MTRYADATDLDTYGALPAATSALFSTAQKNAALDEASAFADGYLASAVATTPLSAWGVDLRGAVARIAAWRLLQGLRGYDAAAQGNSFKTARDEALSWLKDVAKGLVKISGGGSNTTPTQTNGARVSSQASRGWLDEETDDGEC